ncbi:hypothetical protein SAM23877_1076 [Streptomyces ambofaciens ATCC 23877]|uniref:Uncharacterized protein n=2 Tax=Streptomyces ambofaciens (strain ATCC 23877 / 3486 / DSM 40053 / JCM 4204 / NBRC 12836 / NRRL B-2516) TaxID=278992 RepID=A0A0K2AM06_STRA7|nr:hypothetical protein [Streptomyces ambofaciens]AKZ54125.1 hypothetical protein SAM23877_1076 [Streptomyces ambofaciens ATCC 23877]
MSRWSSVLPGRGRRSGSATGRRGTAPQAGGANGAGDRGPGGPPVEDVDGVLLVRSVEDDSFPLDVVAEVAGAVGREPDVVTVIVGSAGGGSPDADHWARLGALLDSLRARGTDRVRLVMSGAGDDRPGRPCVARRIADAWEMEVTAPDGAVLITPGGTLFVHDDSRPGCAWWRFAPGAEPRRAGGRAPAPAWEKALTGVPTCTAGGCVVDRVPAGVVVRPAGAPRPAPDDLCFSMPVDFERLTVLVGAPQAEDVAADEVAAVLAGLPRAERARARLAPGGRRDLLRLGQSVADLLGTEVEVLTGPPLLDDHAPPGTPPRPTLVGRDGKPTWRPFVTSVVCGPVDSRGRAPVPRPTEVRPPDWLLGGSDRGTVRLTDRWQATVTRAGLALWASDGPRPGPLGPAVDPEACAIELGMPGQPLDDSLLPALSRLLYGLGTDLRARTTLLVRGRLPAGDVGLRRLAAEHGIPSIRYVTAGRPRPGGTTGRPAAAAEPGPAPPSGGPAHGSGSAVAPSAARTAPDARPGGPRSGEDARASGGVGRPAAAGPRTDGDAPSRPVKGAGGPVRPVSARGDGPVPTPDSPRVGAGDGSGQRASASVEPPDGAEAVGALRARPAAAPSAGARAAAVGGRGDGAVRGPRTGADGGRGDGAVGGGGDRSGGGRDDGAVGGGGEGTVGGGGVGAVGRGGGETVGARVDGALGGSGGEAAGATGEGAVGEGEDGAAGGGGQGAVGARDDGAVGGGGGGVGGRAGRVAVDGAGPERDGHGTGRAEARPAPQGRVGGASAAPRAALPFVPGHVSGATERAAFREAAGGAWEGHAAAVSRVLTRMPALRGHELEAARTDLVAAHAYLTAEEGPLHHGEVIRDLCSGEGRLLPYAGCLASALRRLPSYRGVAVRGGGADGPGPAVGALLHDPAPVSALAGSSALPAGAPVRYAIWSVTGRKVRQLLDRPGGSTDAYEEIVFVPGTAFRVLGVRAASAGPPVVLLRELPGTATAYMDGSEELSGLDLKARAHLEEALAKGFRVGDGPWWPDRCAGPVGQDG